MHHREAEQKKLMKANENEHTLKIYWEDRWLDAHGGRNRNDVLYENGEAYVLMSICPARMILCGSEFEKVFIPSMATIIKELS